MALSYGSIYLRLSAITKGEIPNVIDPDSLRRLRAMKTVPLISFRSLLKSDVQTEPDFQHPIGVELTPSVSCPLLCSVDSFGDVII